MALLDFFRLPDEASVEDLDSLETTLRHRRIIKEKKFLKNLVGEIGLGQRYRERMWTSIATCKKQSRNFFSFLLESIEAKLIHKPAPTRLSG